MSRNEEKNLLQCIQIQLKICAMQDMFTTLVISLSQISEKKYLGPRSVR